MWNCILFTWHAIEVTNDNKTPFEVHVYIPQFCYTILLSLINVANINYTTLYIMMSDSRQECELSCTTQNWIISLKLESVA